MRLRTLALIVAATLTGCGKDNSVAPVSASARVKVIQAVAGASSIDFGVGDQKTFTGMTFTMVAPSLPGSYTALPAETPLRLRAYLGATTIIDSTVTLLTDLSYTIIASGRASGTGASAPRFVILQDNLTSPASGSIRLRALHAAAAAGSVDVHAALAGAVLSTSTRVFSSLGFRSVAAVDVPAGTYQLCIIGAGLTPTANGSNCGIYIPTSVFATGTVVTEMLRDPNTPSETTPQLQLIVDRTP